MRDIETAITVEVDGRERLLCKVVERAGGDLIFIPTRCSGIFGGIDKVLPYFGRLEPFGSFQFTIHYRPDDPILSQINYHRKNGNTSERRRVLLTNAFKVHDEFCELLFYATGYLNSQVYDVRDGYSQQVSLGSYDPQKFVLCYLAMVSSPGRKYGAATEPVVGHTQVPYRFFGLHFFSFCIPIPTSSKSLRHVPQRYLHDLCKVPTQTQEVLRINSVDERDIRKMIIEHFLHAKFHLGYDPKFGPTGLLMLETPLSPNVAMRLTAAELGQLAQNFRRPRQIPSGGFRLPPIALGF